MSIRRSACALALFALAAAPATADNIINNPININAQYYGYAESGAPVPSIGSTVTPISSAPGGGLLSVTLNAGVYTITNAAGQAGALYDAFSYTASGGEPWTWNFLISNASDGNKVVLFGGINVGIHATEADAAAAAANYSGAFAVLNDNTVLNFMIRDNVLGDNSGGVSLAINRFQDPPAVPEPAAVLTLALGALLPVGLLVRRGLA